MQTKRAVPFCGDVVIGQSDFKSINKKVNQSLNWLSSQVVSSSRTYILVLCESDWYLHITSCSVPTIDISNIVPAIVEKLGYHI